MVPDLLSWRSAGADVVDAVEAAEGVNLRSSRLDFPPSLAESLSL